MNGRVLILEGIEKAERNVLPVLNNLLENREMQLDDGRFLMSASRYDKLLTVDSLLIICCLDITYKKWILQKQKKVVMSQLLHFVLGLYWIYWITVAVPWDWDIKVLSDDGCHCGEVRPGLFYEMLSKQLPIS